MKYTEKACSLVNKHAFYLKLVMMQVTYLSSRSRKWWTTITHTKPIRRYGQPVTRWGINRALIYGKLVLYANCKRNTNNILLSHSGMAGGLVHTREWFSTHGKWEGTSRHKKNRHSDRFFESFEWLCLISIRAFQETKVYLTINIIFINSRRSC